MGKKKKVNQLGRSIIRDRFGSKPRMDKDSHLHTSELGDGYDWNRINLRSVTEETSLDEFLATAELAGTEFTAEKLNIKFVSQESRAGLLSAEEERKIQQTQEEHKQLLRIPRRPSWDANTTAEELDTKEKESFLLWRRELNLLQDVEGITMTPFERNLDFWRQLWRVIERSDIIVQIVDGRNPLLFRSEDLEKYVKEVDSTKLNMILINKADYLTQQQREMWASYFDQVGMKVAFWSAVLEIERIKELNKLEAEGDSSETEDEESSDEDMSDESTVDEDKDEDQEKYTQENSENDSDVDSSQEEDIVSKDSDCDKCGSGDATSSKTSIQSEPSLGKTDFDDFEKLSVTETISSPSDQRNISDSSGKMDNEDLKSSTPSPTGEGVGEKSITMNDPRVLSGPELIELFASLHTEKKHTAGINTIGLVGYPNVGKSSTINALLQTKKVPVSATPGRTKHFQTLYLDPTLMLCDCPGLVMPTFVNTKADMVVNGILPIDQMRDYVPPVSLLSTLIPRSTLEGTYGILIPKPREGEDECRSPTAHELLSAYSFMRGFMSHKGIPDYQRSARHVLKDFVSGKLLYCKAPPDSDIEKFCPTPPLSKVVKERAHPQQQPVGSKTKASVFKSEMDQMFFEQKESRIGMKGSQVPRQDSTSTYNSDTPSAKSSQRLTEKTWKKHKNQGKKEKLRRIYSHLDA